MDHDSFFLKERIWRNFDKNCKGKSLWAAGLSGECSELSKNVFSNVREQIKKCYGYQTLRAMESDAVKILHFPFGGKSVEFLKVLWELNKQRKIAREVMFAKKSGLHYCGEVCMFYFLL